MEGQIEGRGNVGTSVGQADGNMEGYEVVGGSDGIALGGLLGWAVVGFWLGKFVVGEKDG